MSPGEKLGKWTIESGLGEGGQGATYVARDDEARVCCLKILSNHDNKERRQRFAREAACYESLDIDGIPRLIDSNALGKNAADRPLYICTELIEGKPLDKLFTKDASKQIIVASIVRLMRIIHELHQAGIVHRDIKPQNIIARGSDLRDLCIIDFGLAFSSVAQDDFRTEVGQELGNRFLRLPELQAGSRIKQDPISDVTFGVGVLFYLITGISPRSLVDSQGRMPHQRGDLADNRLLTNPEFRSLLPVFDRGFQLRTEERFRSALELIENLEKRATIDMKERQTLDEIIAELNEPSARFKQQRIKHRDSFIDTAHVLARKMAEHLNGVYVCSQTGHEVLNDAAGTHVGFALGQDHQVSERVPFEVKVIGSQIVATAWNEEILRADADTPDWGATLTPAIETALLKALNELRKKTPAARPD